MAVFRLYLLFAIVVVSAPVRAGLAADAGPLDLLEAVAANQVSELEQYYGRLPVTGPGSQSDYQAYYAYQIFNNFAPGFSAPLDNWVKTYPQSVPALIARGLHLYAIGMQYRKRGQGYGQLPASKQKMGNYLQRAADDFIQAVKLDSASTVARAGLINVLNGLGNRRDLDSVARDGLRAVPDSYALRLAYLNAQAPKRGGTFETMVELVEETAAKSRSNPDLERLLGFSYATLADGYSQNRENDKAVDFATKAVLQGLDDASLLNVARIYFHAELYPDADEALDLALALYPARMEALYWKGKIAERQGDADSAAKWYRQALQINPVDTDALHAHARLLAKQGDTVSAEQNYILALEHFGSANPALINDYLILLVREKKQFERAQILAEAHADLFLDSRDLYWFSYGVALAGLRNCRAVGAMKRYLKNCKGVESRCDAGALKLAEQEIRAVVDSGRCDDLPALAAE